MVSGRRREVEAALVERERFRRLVREEFERCWRDGFRPGEWERIARWRLRALWFAISERK